MKSFREGIITQTKYAKEIGQVVSKYIPKEETIHVALKGVHREYLVCTETKVYIIKEGFMTGKFMGNGMFIQPYDKITNVQLDFSIISGFFQVLTGGVSHVKQSYWSQEYETSTSKQPNSISVFKGEDMGVPFKEASIFILNKLEDAQGKKEEEYKVAYMVESNKESTVEPKVETREPYSVVEDIRKYKELLDEGIITKEEFNIKKTRLLNID